MGGLGSKKGPAVARCEADDNDWTTCRAVDHAVLLHRQAIEADRSHNLFRGVEWANFFESACRVFRNAGRWEECRRCLDQMEAVVERERSRSGVDKSLWSLLSEERMAETSSALRGKQEYWRWVAPCQDTLEAMADAGNVVDAVETLQSRMIDRLGLEPNVACWNACLRACVNGAKREMERYDGVVDVGGVSAGRGGPDGGSASSKSSRDLGVTGAQSLQFEARLDFIAMAESLLEQFEDRWRARGYTGPGPDADSYSYVIASCMERRCSQLHKGVRRINQ